jgi:hypothetical protein
MAIIEHLPPPEDRKDMGNVECYTDKFGRNIMRSKPLDRSPGMIISSLRQSKLGKLMKQVVNNINTAYAGSVQGNGMNAWNRVMSINRKHCFVGDTDGIDPSSLVLCDNDGSFVDNVVLTSTDANTITGTFDSNAQNADEGADLVKAYGFNVKGNKIWQFDQAAIRSTGTITLTQPQMSGLKIAVYFECLDRVHLLMDKPKHVIKYVGTLTVQ